MDRNWKVNLKEDMCLISQFLFKSEHIIPVSSTSLNPIKGLYRTHNPSLIY